jgi:hypothetical protein
MLSLCTRLELKTTLYTKWLPSSNLGLASASTYKYQRVVTTRVGLSVFWQVIVTKLTISLAALVNTNES